MFWNFKGYNISFYFVYWFLFWSFKGYNIGLCFGASKVIILVCVLELQGYNSCCSFKSVFRSVLELQGLL